MSVYFKSMENPFEDENPRLQEEEKFVYQNDVYTCTLSTSRDVVSRVTYGNYSFRYNPDYMYDKGPDWIHKNSTSYEEYIYLKDT